jgi:hypothetical protein
MKNSFIVIHTQAAGKAHDQRLMKLFRCRLIRRATINQFNSPTTGKFLITGHGGLLFSGDGLPE